MNDADPRTPVDPLAQILAGLDQHLAMVPHLGVLLAAEWHACAEAGMPAVAAAVLIGTRWSSTT